MHGCEDGERADGLSDLGCGSFDGVDGVDGMDGTREH